MTLIFTILGVVVYQSILHVESTSNNLLLYLGSFGRIGAWQRAKQTKHAQQSASFSLRCSGLQSGDWVQHISIIISVSAVAPVSRSYSYHKSGVLLMS